MEWKMYIFQVMWHLKSSKTACIRFYGGKLIIFLFQNMDRCWRTFSRIISSDDFEMFWCMRKRIFNFMESYFALWTTSCSVIKYSPFAIFDTFSLYSSYLNSQYGKTVINLLKFELCIKLSNNIITFLWLFFQHWTFCRKWKKDIG